MISKEKFESIGGFYEGLPVAFNDVDLCYTLIEKGFRNICLNNIYLLHHESYSRGNDTKSIEKTIRLSHESRHLMKRHLSFIGKDPFVPENVLNKVFKRRYPSIYDIGSIEASGKKRCAIRNSSQILKGAVLDKAVFTCVEYADKHFMWDYETDTFDVRDESIMNDFAIWGYSFVIEADNALYDRYVLLKKCDVLNDEIKEIDGEIFVFDTYPVFRPDIKKEIEDQKNVELCGFYSKIYPSELSSGVYKVGILHVKRYTKQKIYNYGHLNLII